jgi:hypothetical protein
VTIEVHELTSREVKEFVWQLRVVKEVQRLASNVVNELD